MPHNIWKIQKQVKYTLLIKHIFTVDYYKYYTIYINEIQYII